MLVYSKKIVKFTQEINRFIKACLKEEIGLKVVKERFYNRRQDTSYPIISVIFNTKSMLGYFDPNFYELGFHESLMHASRELLHNIIRHELAHYITYIDHGSAILPHGVEFKTFCQALGWGEEVYRATTCLDDGAQVLNTEESSVLRKVQKLMALATSCNENESEQALIKSQELLLKHNIDANYLESDDEAKIFLKRILKQKKENAKLRSIATILKTFFVNTVYNRRGEFTYLEIIGTGVNVEIGEYVANFLNSELDRLWDGAKTKYPALKGMVAKNSFFLGIAKGYCNKINFLKQAYHSDLNAALMVIENKLVDANSMVYPRLTSRKTFGGHCRASSAMGELAGRQLHINPAIKSNQQNSLLYLT